MNYMMSSSKIHTNMSRYINFKKKLMEDLAVASFKEVVWKYNSEYELNQRLSNPKDIVYLDEFEIEVIKDVFGDSSYNSTVKQKTVQMLQGGDGKISITIQKHITGWFIGSIRIMSEELLIERYYICPQIGKDGLRYLCMIIQKEIQEYKKEEEL